jgi:ABC-type multidrug transport system ATPase subunit
MIEVQHLIKVYNGQQVVDDISSRLEAGKTLVLLGTSGCGKTTTLRMLNRLIEPTSGKVLIDQKDISTVLLKPNPQEVKSLGSNPDSVFHFVSEHFREDYALTWLQPLGFNNTYALMMRGKKELKQYLN